MAIGTGWVDGAWVDAGWVDGAWDAGLPAFVPAYGPVALLNLDIFFNFGFAEPVFFGAVELTGIFTAFNTDGFDQSGPTVRMRQSDVEDNAIVPGSALTIRSDIYRVDARQDDGVGTSLLLLNIRA